VHSPWLARDNELGPRRWNHILVSRLCLLVSWLSLGIPNGFNIYIYSLLALD
jgi:hypothetical protein